MTDSKQNENLYEILEVDPKLSCKEIVEKYLAWRLLHGKVDWKRYEALKILQDPGKRKEYDTKHPEFLLSTKLQSEADEKLPQLNLPPSVRHIEGKKIRRIRFASFRDNHNSLEDSHDPKPSSPKKS